MPHQPNPKEKSGKAGEVVFVCPSCLTRYRFDRSEVDGKARLCDYCHVPLVREDRNHRALRCWRCGRRIVTPEGVWCTHFDCAPTPEEAAHCLMFSPRARARRARRSR